MAILSRAYNGSFDGVSFMLLVPLTRPPTTQSDTDYHVPGTDSNLTIDLGKMLRKWSQKIGIDAGDLASIEAKVGHSGTYVGPSGVSYSNTRLKAIDSPVKAPGFAAYEVTLQLSIDN